MIKKIICPTDFSSVANNAVEYAAKLSQVFNAELMLVHIQVISPLQEVGIMLGMGNSNLRDDSRIVADRLKEMSAEINKMFKISCSYELDITSISMAEMITSIGFEQSMIVMGTNGSDNLYQYFFGTNTYLVIKKAQCNVLVVPEKVDYGIIKKIVFLWDRDAKTKYSFFLLNDFFKGFNPQLMFLFVGDKGKKIEADVFEDLQREIIPIIDNKDEISFDQVYTDNLATTINERMVSSGADLLVMNYHQTSLLKDVFDAPVSRDLIDIAQYPILVLHN